MLRRVSVGSFRKTNPPGGCFGGVRLPRGRENPSPQSFAVYDNGVSRTRLPQGERRMVDRTGRHEAGFREHTICETNTQVKMRNENNLDGWPWQTGEVVG